MTNATAIATTELDSIYENAIVFHRENGDQVTFSVQHNSKYHELVISICASDEPLDDVPGDLIEGTGPDEPLAKVTLSYAEAKLLKALLNRPEVAALLDQE